MADEKEPTHNPHDDYSHGVVKCDTCGVDVIRKVDKEQKEDIQRAMKDHTKSTGHKEYSFYMQHLESSDLGSRSDD